MFIGRKKELNLLNEFYKKKSGQIAILYGRRRVGKSALIQNFCQNKHHLYFEGIENERSQKQIQHVVNQLKKQTGDKFLSQTIIKTWEAVFEYLTQKIATQQKIVLVFDELQWMAARQGKLVSLIKYYCDNFWKEKNVFLILCGSISSYMINKVVKSKALYGRIDLEVHLKALLPFEAKELLSHRSPEEIIKYLIVFGGIPKYLEEVHLNKSFDHNVNELCFRSNGFMVNEFEKIFYGQFTEAVSYLKIVKALSTGPKTLKEISDKTRIASGGGLKLYLKNLIEADFVSEQRPFQKTQSSHLRKYKIIDEYLNLYFKYIAPNRGSIHADVNKYFFQKIIKSQWQSWLGLAFERYCVKHAVYLAERMGFADDLVEFGSVYEKSPQGFQIDLVYRRLDKVIVLCEIKFCQQEIDTKIIPEIEKKIAQYEVPRGYTLEKALISLYGPSPSLKDSEYFQYHLTLRDILAPHTLS